MSTGVGPDLVGYTDPVTYAAMVGLAHSTSLQARIIACAAEQGIPSPEIWVQGRMWKFATQPGWDDAWDYAQATYTPAFNPDIGARPDVITDLQILAAVLAVNV